ADGRGVALGHHLAQQPRGEPGGARRDHRLGLDEPHGGDAIEPVTLGGPRIVGGGVILEHAAAGGGAAGQRRWRRRPAGARGVIGRPSRANTAKASVISSRCKQEAPSANDEQNSRTHLSEVTSGEWMPSRSAQCAVSWVPTRWKMSTEGGFFDHTSARSSDTAW